jgi:hypothetical protein
MTEDAEAAKSRLARGRLSLHQNKARAAALDPKCLASRDSKRLVHNMDMTLAGLESYLQSLRNTPH